MKSRRIKARGWACAAALFVTAIAGCGGGGGGGGSDTSVPATPTPSPSSGPSVARPRLTVTWPARTRGQTGAVSSALSLRIIITGAGPSGGDINFVVNRAADSAAYSQVYTAPTDVLLGTYELHLRFCADRDGAGAIVATADAPVTLGSDGTLPDVATNAVIRSVEVPADQEIMVGENRELGFAAYDDQHRLVAVTRGSARFVRTGAEGVLDVTPDGVGHGTLPGETRVTAEVDGAVSAEARVFVRSNAQVVVTPGPTVALSLGALQAFTASVANDPTNAGVMWDVDGGTITPDGVYQAPQVTGEYHIGATSRYDGTKRTVVTVRVEAGNISVGGTFPPSGGVGVTID